MTISTNLFTDPAALAQEIHAVMLASDENRREALAGRIASQMISAARKPAPPPQVVARFAGIDHSELATPSEISDAIVRRLAQVAAINSLLGKAFKLVGEVPDGTFDDAAWAVRDLTDEAAELTGLLQAMTERRCADSTGGPLQ